MPYRTSKWVCKFEKSERVFAMMKRGAESGFVCLHLIDQKHYSHLNYLIFTAFQQTM